jgi:hypothetical protein
VANMVIDSLAFALADVLETQLELDGGKLRGEVTRTVDVMGISVPITGKIVSQQFNKANHMVLVRMTGNLVLALCAVLDSKHKTIVHLWVCNLAKSKPPENLLEQERPGNITDLKKVLGASIVKRFVRNGSTRWEAA